jgi:hypothetical protein
VGVNRTYLTKLEKGASYPGLEIIGKLTTVLEIELRRLRIGAATLGVTFGSR